MRAVSVLAAIVAAVLVGVLAAILTVEVLEVILG